VDAAMVQVAAGRGMSEAEVRKIAKGRVWSGKDALAHGLVDCLGGLQDAITLAKQQAGLPLDVSIMLLSWASTPLFVRVSLHAGAGTHDPRGLHVGAILALEQGFDGSMKDVQ